MKLHAIRHILFFLLITTAAFADKTSEQIQDYIFENLPEYGTIKQDALGFVYVDISDDYIHKLVEFIEGEGYEEPPYFGRGGHGAHISIIYAAEAGENHIDSIEEIGNTVYFKIKGCKIINPENKEGVDALYLIPIDCPALHKIRKKYGLPKMKYEFHITIGIKYTQEEAA